MAEYIKREDVIEKLTGLFQLQAETAKAIIESIPTANVRPVVQNEKKILDVTCGSRQIWFDKKEPHTIYCDRREGKFEIDVKGENPHHKTLEITPDVICDFTDLPFDDDSFSLVVFDPPHVEHLSSASWMYKAFTSLDGDWKPMIRKGFEECMRVLKPDGVLVFKWSDVSISTREIINVIGQEPLFGHRSGKKMNTHWMCFMKFDDHPNCGVRMGGDDDS